METTLTEFRQNTKKYFDLALQSPVYVKRGGVVFELKSTAALPFGRLKDAGEPVEMVVTGLPNLLTKPKGTHKLPKGLVTSIPEELKPKFCKEGHSIPYPRDRCLGKGCKYG